MWVGYCGKKGKHNFRALSLLFHNLAMMESEMKREICCLFFILFSAIIPAFKIQNSGQCF